MDKTNKSSFVETVDAVDNTDVKFVDLNTQIDDKYNTDKYKNNKIPINISKFDYSINGDELFLIGDSFLDLKGLVSHHLESANNFYLNGIKQIITQGFKIEKKIINRRNITPEDKEIDWIHCEVIPTDVQLKSPTTLRFLTGAETMLFPKNALIREKNYSGTLYISCIAKKTAHYKNGTERTETDELKLFRISKIPIIKGSVACNTYGKSKDALMQMGEDPSDPGGYFIISGEWAVDCTENITYNQPKIYINEGYGKSRVRCEFMSKPGDAYQNSDMLLVILNSDDTLTIEIMRNKLVGVKIPFYLLFRALGWSTDSELLQWIIFDYDNPINQRLTRIIKQALKVKYTSTTQNTQNIYGQVDALTAIIDMIPEEQYKYLDLKSKPENYHLAITDLLSEIDLHCLPHIGTGCEHRYEKLKFLALIVRKTIFVWFRYIPQTDRDSFRNKRIHSAGINYAKTLKTYFHQTFVMPIKRRMLKDFNNTTFSHVNLPNMIKSAVYADDFERLIVQTIISGNKSNLRIRKKNITNRLQTQQLHRKTQLNTIATMRQVSATSADSAKQSERAIEMRRVHMSGIGYICVNHSRPEGEKVGINKQLAIFASIAPASSSEVLRKIILSDPEIILESALTPISIFRGQYARVFVNGYFLGYTRDSIPFTNKYRKMRRRLEISPYTTIYWDNTQNEIQFFVDMGRLCRPLIIVYNNWRDKECFDKKYLAEIDRMKLDLPSGVDNFIQGVLITADDIKQLYQRKKTIDDLLVEQKIEYITPEEQEISLISCSFGNLLSEKHNPLRQYTHCDIPQSQLGITALTSPFANHNQGVRITYQTSQSKQSCGYYTLNWPFRMDKETSLQYINELPLVCTVANKYLFPNGNNCMVAMMCYTGFNQEDSLLMSKASVERGMFDVSKFTTYRVEIEPKEDLGTPDASKTEGIKSGASYAKIINGSVQRGMIVKPNDVLIAKYMELPKNKDDKYEYIDRSLVYKEDEHAIIHGVVVGRDEEEKRFCKVAMRKIRPIVVGEKFCLRPTAQVLTSIGWITLRDIEDKHLIATIDPITHKLSYVKSTEKPTFPYNSSLDGKMYSFRNATTNILCTPNHKLFVSFKVNNVYQPYRLVEARECYGKEKMFLHTAQNTNADLKSVRLTEGCIGFVHDATQFLTLCGIYHRCGKIDKQYIWFKHLDGNELQFITKTIDRLNIRAKLICSFLRIDKATSRLLYEYFAKHSGIDRSIIHKLSINDAKAVYNGIYMQNLKFCPTQDIFSQIILHAGYNHILYNNLDLELFNDSQTKNTIHKKYSICINTTGYLDIDDYLRTGIKPNHTKSELDIISRDILRIKNIPDVESWVDYVGSVMCLTIPDTNLFYYREDENSQPVWTGNSARSGQKGIVALKMREADLPFTETGIHPDIIFNPHGIPSRMTAGQLIEALVGNVCAIKGTHYDGTIFKTVDLESIAEELEQYGFNRYGYERMISGLTGEYIDTLVSFGPTFYQHLQKFVADVEYSVKNAMTDVITLQPLGGMSSNGGLRIGEMEHDVISAHGSSRLLQEKFFNHSDGYVEYICRCGKPAIINHKENIYKCLYCKDNADICAIPTSWTSKLFMQEMESINIGIRRIPRPFTYETHQSQDQLPRIDEYNEQTMIKLASLVEDMVDDGGVGLDEN